MKARHLVLLLAGILAVSLAAPAAAQTEAPRTAWGAPDLQGIWDFRTITPMERPEELGDRVFLTEEEAANLEQATVDRNAQLLVAEARRTEAGGQRRGPTTTSGWTGARARSATGARRSSSIRRTDAFRR